LLGKVVEEGPERYRATWEDEHGKEQSAVFTSEREAVTEIARKHAGVCGSTTCATRARRGWSTTGCRYDAQRLLGHSKPSTTLDLYTHYQRELDPRVGELLADFSLTDDQDGEPDDGAEDDEDAV
jgi:integrase